MAAQDPQVLKRSRQRVFWLARQAAQAAELGGLNGLHCSAEASRAEAPATGVSIERAGTSGCFTC